MLAALVVTPSSSALPAHYLDDPVALDLLRKSATADERVSYSGTQYVSAWSSLRASEATASAVVEIGHSAGGSTAVWVHNQQEPMFLANNATQWLVEAGGSVALVAAAYSVRLGGTQYVAGRLTDIVEAVRENGSTAARLWLDRGTALTLRRETFDVDGAMLSASAFVDLEITNASACCQDPVVMNGTNLYQPDIEQLRTEGWTCPPQLANNFAMYDARQVGDVIQTSYSDGLMSASVFQQPGTLDHTEMAGYARRDHDGGALYVHPGPPARYIWSSQGRVITVVSDAPADVVDALINIAPPDGMPETQAKKDGFTDRVARGAQRVGSFLNPFD